ncbi:FAD-dependent oxidoreductase [Paenibacillus sp. PL2-23]|uniref:NAD(P)/FAD-dependent oxidoreductase n=1 Tax=Paenibacillus sp. PL2-23 TaxID=2100729 RepID=UPI0030F7C1D3
MNRVYDVVVLGAGIAGCAAAKLLAERGRTVMLLDRHKFPRHKVCGEFLSPEAQGTLARLGLLKDVLGLGPSRMSRTAIHLRSGGVLDLPLPGTALGVSRWLLDERLQLAAKSAGADFRDGAIVTSVTRRGDYYAVQVRSGKASEELLVRAVIGAWGGAGVSLGDWQEEAEEGAGRSKRERKGASALGVKMHYRFGRETEDSGVTREKGNRGRSEGVELYFFRGGYIGLNAIEAGKINVAALLDPDDIPALHKNVPAMLEEAIGRSPRLADRMSGSMPIMGSSAAVSPVRISYRPLPWKGMPLVGDAICRIPPLCGDGMSMGLRSAELCVSYTERYLQGELTLAQWERDYSAAITAEFSGPLRSGRIAQTLLEMPLLSHVLPLLARLAPGAARGLIRATRLSGQPVPKQ